MSDLIEENQDIQEVLIEDSMKGSYLDYSMSVIVGRALPDARDGLKPVHRRILYAMNDLNLSHRTPYKKSARIVGDVVGKYHPHGDTAVYDALVRMAQDFSLREPLIDGQGNFGSIDGDNAAAMRYCVTGDTIIKTDRGLVYIEDLVKNSKVNSDNSLNIEVLSIGNNRNRASKFFNSGKQTIYELKTKEGYSINGTANHPILTVTSDNSEKPTYSWKRLDKISLDDKIVIDKSGINLSGKKITQEERNRAIIAGRLLSEKLNSNLELEDKRVPKFILQFSKEAQELFLQHLFNRNDSFLRVKKDTLYISCPIANERLLQDIQILLLEFGVVGKITQVSNQDEVRLYLDNLEFLNSNYYYASVKSCQKTDREDIVYSIKVDSSCHSFVANGLINHNTEARMTKISEELLKDIEKDTVDFVPNYDDSISEPDVLPSRVPNLLLNGSSGIAVGMATNIPPHRLDELVKALLYLIENPNCKDSEIFNIIQGPDFPTGGIIFGKKGILDAYSTGRGRIKIRAKVHIEEKRNREVIVVDELPYQVNKSRVIESIASLVKEKHIDGISEIRDESDRDGMRIVIELKKDAMSDIILNNLYKSTQLEVTFGIIMLAIANKEPKVFKLRQLLELFLKHRKTVIIRRTIFQLDKATARVHILEGLKKAVNNIGRVIKIIKESKDSERAKEELMSGFELSITQAVAILEMKLRRLTGLEQEKIDSELAELYREIEYLRSILKSENILNGIIAKELKEIGDSFKSKRRTEIIDDYDDIDIEDLIPNEPMVVTITHRGYIKRVAVKQYEKQKRGGKGKIALTTHDDDFIEQFFISSTHDTLMFVTDMGQLYWLKVYRIPEGSRIAKGKAVVNLINLRPNEKIMSIIPTTDFHKDKSLVFFTNNGIVKRTNLKEYSNIRANGIRAINLDDHDSLVTAKIVKPNTKWLFIITKKGQCIRFKISDVREIGRAARGVTGIRFKLDGDFVCGATTIEDKNDELLMLSEKGIGKRTVALEYREQSRGGKGVIGMRLTAKTGDVVGVVFVEDDKDLMCLTSIGKMIRVDMHTIRKAGRNTSGVKVVNVEKKDIVVSMAKCPKEETDRPDVVNDEIL
jgi:DNA gyrase subunit A